MLKRLFQIPFDEFMLFIFEDDKSIFGVPRETDDIDAHSELMKLQWADLSAGPGDLSNMHLNNNILWLGLEIERLQKIVLCLDAYYDERICDILKEQFDYEFSQESYKEDLDKVAIEMKSLEIKLEGFMEEKRLREEEMAERNEDGSQVISYEYYAKIMNYISEMEGAFIPITTNTMQVGLLIKKLLTPKKTEIENG